MDPADKSDTKGELAARFVRLWRAQRTQLSLSLLVVGCMKVESHLQVHRGCRRADVACDLDSPRSVRSGGEEASQVASAAVGTDQGGRDLASSGDWRLCLPFLYFNL